MEHLQPIDKNPLNQCVLRDMEDFEGLMPKAIDKLGGIGVPEEPVNFPTLDPRSAEALEVVDVVALAEGE